MLTNTILNAGFGLIALCFSIAIGIIVSKANEGKWYYGAFGGFVVFLLILTPLRPPANALALSDAEIENLRQELLLEGPGDTWRFFCDGRTFLGFPKGDPYHYLLLTKGTERPILHSQEKATACYQQNRRIF